MKNVLIVMPSMKMGGAEKSLISLLSRLSPEVQQELGISVELMVANTNGELYGEIPTYIRQVEAPADFRCFITQLKELLTEKSWTIGCMLRKIQWQIKKNFCKNPEGLTVNELYWRKMSRYLKPYAKEYDVAISYMDGTASYYVVDKICAKKKIVWVHNQLAQLKVTKKFLDEFFSKVDGIVTISDLCVDSIVTMFPEYRYKTVSIPNLSDADYIRKRADMFYPEEYTTRNAPIILSIGRLCAQKGFDIGIEAAKVLSDRGVDFSWYIMGNGNLENQLQDMINERKLRDKVTLLGVKKNPYPYIKNCCVVFQPSRYEGKSIVLDEAKILMKPIVSSNYDTVYDQIENGVSGIVAKLNPKNLADALQQVITSDVVRSELAGNLKKELENQPDEFARYKPILTGEI